MKLSVIERMVREGDLSADGLRFLLNCRAECEWLDYKHTLDLTYDKQLRDFTKDVVGMKNVGGGFLVIGVQDKTWLPVGLSSPLPFDAKLLRDQIRRSDNLELDIDIVHHDLEVNQTRRVFAAILVRGSKKRAKRRTPTLIGKDFCTNQTFGLRRGDIYIRKGDSTVKVQTEQELEDLLDDLEAAADNESLLAAGQHSPFAIQDGTYRLLPRGFETFIGRHTLRDTLMEAVTQDPRIWIINVHGPGGVGKSALVNWAAYDLYSQRKFDSIIHLTAKETMLTESGIRPFSRSLYSLENLLDHVLDAFQETIPHDLDGKRQSVLEILSAFKVLLVLDNMETVSDGRILTFVQRLPKESLAKILLTSRQKTGGWELPIPVNELNEEEVAEFLRIKSADLGVSFPLDPAICRKVWEVSGGLPLAIQWTIGRYRVDNRVEMALSQVDRKDSPVLEFSFRNIWNAVSADARAILACMTVFEEAPTAQQVSIATEWAIERIEKALEELENVTLVTKLTQPSDGRVIFTALPITLAFARHQFDTMGDFETRCRQRYQKYIEQIELEESELYKFRSDFVRYGLATDNEKKAYVLCQRGFGELNIGNVPNAELFFKQARDTAPNSAYVYAMCASHELARHHIGQALDYANEACKRCTKNTGALCYTIMARIRDAQRDKNGRVAALGKAIEYEPTNVFLRHQLGVALSRAGYTEAAIAEFDKIIAEEKVKAPARETLLMALKTKIINLRRLKKNAEATAELAYARQVLADSPHLRGQSHHIDELED